MKAKVAFSSITNADAILVKFDKPGWGPLRLRTGDEAGGADTLWFARASVRSSNAKTSAANGQYASNGKVQLKIVEVDPKVTGIFVTTELLNLTKETFDLIT